MGDIRHKMKYKVGDKVRVKHYYKLPDDVRSKLSPLDYVVTIKSVSSGITKWYDLKEVRGWHCPYKYIEKMIEEKCDPVKSRFELLDLRL